MIEREKAEGREPLPLTDPVLIDLAVRLLSDGKRRYEAACAEHRSAYAQTRTCPDHAECDSLFYLRQTLGDTCPCCQVVIGQEK